MLKLNTASLPTLRQTLLPGACILCSSWERPTLECMEAKRFFNMESLWLYRQTS
ncbi:hypothetical protein DPEC_G00330960, partial [Dallia pectoralis]